MLILNISHSLSWKSILKYRKKIKQMTVMTIWDFDWPLTMQSVPKITYVVCMIHDPLRGVLDSTYNVIQFVWDFRHVGSFLLWPQSLNLFTILLKQSLSITYLLPSQLTIDNINVSADNLTDNKGLIDLCTLITHTI